MIRLRFAAFSSLIPILLLVLITFITYINILPNNLFFDDEELIYKNSYVQNLKFLPKYFTSNMIEGAGKISNMYRPILTLSFAVDFLLFRDNPFGYHMTSIILHAANAVLVFILLKRLFRNIMISFLTAILFSVHPAISEAVIYASGRTDPLYVFFLLITLLIFNSFAFTKSKSILKYFMIVIFYILSLLSKESAIIIPLLLPLILIIRYDGKQKNLSKSVFLFISLLIISFIYVYLRLSILNFDNTINFYSNTLLSPNADIYSQKLLVRFYTFSKTFFDYLSLLIFPKDLIISRNINVITQFSNPWVIGLLTFFIIMFSLGIKFYRRSKIILFSFLFFTITILPVSGIIPINNIMAEHYLYLPSISFFLLSSYFLNYYYKRSSSPVIKSTVIICVIIFIFSLGIRTLIRTFDWRNPEIFYTRSLRQSPWSIPMRHNLAMYYQENGNIPLALNEYKILTSQTYVYPMTYHNLGSIYLYINNFKEAEKHYLKALEIDPRFYFSIYALENLYKVTRNSEKLKSISLQIKSLSQIK